jgi:hypothetical protein
MTRLQKLVVLVLMLPPWAALVVVSYWLLIDNRNPVQVVYQHPKFTDRDVANRQEAARHEVDAAASGDFVWIYRELCVHSSLYGTARGSWISGAFLWQTPERMLFAELQHPGADDVADARLHVSGDLGVRPQSLGERGDRDAVDRAPGVRSG